MADVAIVGAGLAGLAAARVLADQGLHVELLEASDRVGGRARTIAEGHDGLPVELGPEFVHGTPRATLDLVREAGLELETIADTHHVRRGGHLVDAGDLWGRFGELIAAARGAASDESVRAYLARSRMAADDARMLAHLVEGFYAAPLDDISVASVAADTSGAAGDDSGQQFRIVGGYGRLVDWLAARIARDGAVVRHGYDVHAIDWSGSRVRVDFRRGPAHGSITADRVIVTLPVGVLRAPAVRFEPDLGDHAAALQRFAMGQVVKLVLCLREPVWQARAPHELAFVHGDDGGFPTFWLRTRDDAQQLTAWAGGPHARALAGCTADELAERAIDGFASAVEIARARVAVAVRDVHVHDFAADPFARGAYSYTRVGGLGAAEIFARPLGDKLFFAGEVTDAAYEGTVAGALASGARAAAQILARRRGRAARR